MHINISGNAYISRLKTSKLLNSPCPDAITVRHGNSAAQWLSAHNKWNSWRIMQWSHDEKPCEQSPKVPGVVRLVDRGRREGALGKGAVVSGWYALAHTSTNQTCTQVSLTHTNTCAHTHTHYHRTADTQKKYQLIFLTKMCYPLTTWGLSTTQ